MVKGRFGRILHTVDRRKALGLIVILLVLAVILILVMGKESKGPLIKILPQGVDIQMKDIVYTDVGKDGTRMEIRAKTGQYLKEEGKAVFERIIAVLDQPGGHRYTLTGDRGIMWTEKKNIDVYGNVIIMWDDGQKLTTESIHYNGSRRILWTDDPVVHEGPRMRVQGKGLVVYLDKKELKLKSEVKASVQQP